MNLEDYLNQDNIYEPYLKLSFELLDTHLEYMKNEGEYIIEDEELLSDDLVNITVD